MEIERQEDIDKGSLDREKLIEIYSDLGLYLMYQDEPEDRIEKFREKYGDIRNELLYLDSRDIVSIDDKVENISLKSSDRTLARRIADKVHNEKKQPSEVIELSWIPDYLSSPEIKERYQGTGETIDQNPSEEISTRIFEILSEDGALYPSEVEERFSTDISPDPAPWLIYLEAQDAVERTKEDKYRLVEENISDSFFGEKLNTAGRLKDEQNHGNDPWKF
jgi:hypothetical protein